MIWLYAIPFVIGLFIVLSSVDLLGLALLVVSTYAIWKKLTDDFLRSFSE